MSLERAKAKVVVFDLGKVLLDFDYSIAARALAARGRVTPEEIQSFIDHSPLLVRYEKGHISRVEFFEEVQQMSGYTGSVEDFFALFSDVFTPIKPMIQLQAQLRSAGVPTYIFSNTNDLAIEHVKATYPFYSNFNGYVLSYEHGFMKPESELYEVVETMCGCSGAEILYLDDRQENIAAGADRGWATICHRSGEVSIKAVNEARLQN